MPEQRVMPDAVYALLDRETGALRVFSGGQCIVRRRVAGVLDAVRVLELEEWLWPEGTWQQRGADDSVLWIELIPELQAVR